ncbi:MAG: hypothetical protein CM1200mP22_22830 [Dehalococcoidia bacterium]|nr:MAG: hypothetical protein CM1200mP22_22830 [Dehalococcoidia bacterium]
MNLRLSILLVVVLVIFGGTFLVLRFTDSNEPKSTSPWLYRIDEGDILAWNWIPRKFGNLLPQPCKFGLGTSGPSPKALQIPRFFKSGGVGLHSC